MNKVILIGVVQEPPLLNSTESGSSVLNIRLEVDDSYMDYRTNERKQRASWHNVKVWGRSAEEKNGQLAEGQTIAVCGRIAYRTWTDKEGNKRSATDIVAETIDVVSGPVPRKSAANAHRETRKPYGAEPQPASGTDDFPF